MTQLEIKSKVMELLGDTVIVLASQAEFQIDLMVDNRANKKAILIALIRFCL